MTEQLARQILEVAASMISGLSPLAGTLLKWAGEVAFEVYDREKGGAERVAVAQHVADRTVDLIESLKVGG